MKFQIEALTEKGKKSVEKILKNKKFSMFQKTEKINDEPLTIIWIFKMFKKVPASKVSEVNKQSFLNTIHGMFDEDTCKPNIDYEVLII